jgi:hypothetical protein
VVNEHDSTQQAEREAAAAEAFRLPKPARRRERRRVKLTATLVVLVLAVLGLASYKFTANAGHDQRPTAAGHPGASAPAPPVSASSVHPSSATASPSSATTAPPAQVLTVASVAAFGPGGLADGQDPQGASLALSGNAATPWLSDWYVSPDFYDLPVGTGLLVDMGKTVTVTSVRVSINSRGASLQLRAGSKPTPTWLPVVASAANAGGPVQLHPQAPVHVRYLLIWFTQLAPDASGTYQASVYKIVVSGQP